LVNAIDDKRKVAIRSALSSQESERNRISREIHDGVGQLLTVIKIQMESAQFDSPNAPKIKDLVSLLTNAIGELKNISYNLQPVDLASENICDLLFELCSQASLPGKVRVNLGIDNSSNYKLLTPDRKLHVFRIVQEALNNCLKYSKANLVSVEMKTDKRQVCLEIRDDGVGFDPEAIVPGNGLKNINLRAELLQSHAVITSQPGEGTSISLSFGMFNAFGPVSGRVKNETKKNKLTTYG
jgi:signal transduction histidine kinase